MTDEGLGAEVEAATAAGEGRDARARDRLLPALGFWCSAVALLAVVAGWHVRLSDYGAELGRPHAAYVVLVSGGVCAALFVITWWRPDLRVLDGVAVPFAAVAAIAGLVGITTADEPVVTGPGPWLSLFGFVAVGVIAVVAASYEPAATATYDVGDEAARRGAERVRNAVG